LLAPVLAVALAFSIAAAVSYLPVGSQTSIENSFLPTSSQTPTQNEPSPEPTNGHFIIVAPTPSPKEGTFSQQTQTPLPSSVAQAATPNPTSTPVPTAIPMSGLSSPNFLPFIAAAAAVILGVVAALVLFSEKSLRKELSNGQPS